MTEKRGNTFSVRKDDLTTVTTEENKSEPDVNKTREPRTIVKNTVNAWQYYTEYIQSFFFLQNYHLTKLNGVNEENILF